MADTRNPRQFALLLCKVLIIVGSLVATAAALLGLLATRSKLLMGVLGFDGFVSLQHEQGITAIDRYGGWPHQLVVYILLAVLTALSACAVAATWRAARHRPLPAALHFGADLCHGGMWSVLTTALCAALLHITDRWDVLIYGYNNQTISHYMMQVRPPRYDRITMVLIGIAVVAVLFAWGLRHVAPSPRTVTDLTRKTLAVLAVGVAMHLVSLLGPIDRTTGMFTTAALSTLAVFWALGTFGLQAIAVPLARTRYPQGHCQSCGYNLHGSAGSECPECGNAIPVLAQTPTA